MAFYTRNKVVQAGGGKHGWFPRRRNTLLRDLEMLTGELEELQVLLRQEVRPPARCLILERVQEIMNLIGKGFAAI